MSERPRKTFDQLPTPPTVEWRKAQRASGLEVPLPVMLFVLFFFGLAIGIRVSK